MNKHKMLGYLETIKQIEASSFKMKENNPDAHWLVIPAVVVGECVCEWANTKHKAKIIGVTSRGIFIQIGNKRVLFVSYEKYTGPLTINLNQKLVNGTQYLKDGQTVQFMGDLLIIPEAKIRIDMSVSSIRTNGIRKSSIESLFPKLNNLTFLIDTAMKGVSKSELFEYLLHLLSPVEPNIVGKTKDIQHNEIARPRYAFSTGSISGLSDSFSKLIGRGQGLTPSGDDLIFGITLLINRWKHALSLEFDLYEFNRKVIDLAFNETTLLSANLIRCAAEGKADERMEALADSIFANNLPPLESVMSWFSWGSTSGVDALLGMGIAVVESCIE